LKILRKNESEAAVVCVKAVHNCSPDDQLCKKMWLQDSPDTLEMAKELDIKGRRYWVLSEPEGGGWKARVVEVREDGSSEQLGIDASGTTRSSADDAAERKLRRLLQAC